MKKVLNLLLTLLILISLFGCHGKKIDAKKFEVPEEFDTSKDYEITFWAKNDSNANQTKIYNDAIENFEKLYPNIKVKMVLYTDYTKIYNDVITNISTNTTPNVCITYPDHIATYITGNNTVASLDELMADPKYGFGGSELKFVGPTKDEVVKEYLDEGILANKQYAIPFMRSTEACYINEDFVKKLGYELPETLTWDFVFEVSEKAISTLNTDGTYFVNNQKVLIPFIYKSTDNMMIQMLHQLNADYSSSDGKVLIFNDDTKEILKEIAKHAKTKSFSTFKISSYPANFLNAGQCIFAIDSTAGSTWMGSDAPLIQIPPEKLVKFNTRVMAIPQYDVNNPSMISQGPSICVFSKDDANETLASWLFAQYLLTDDVQLEYSKTEGYVPVTYKCQNSDKYQEYINSKENDEEHYHVKLDAAKLLVENINNTFVTPVFNGSASLRTAAGQLIEEVCKTINRKKEVDDKYIEDLYKDVNSLYRLDQTSILSSNNDLGELPKEAKVLLISLGTAWILIGFVFLNKKLKNK